VDTVSAAPSRSLELSSSFSDAERSFDNASSTVCLNSVMLAAMLRACRSRSSPDSDCLRASASRSNIVSRKAMTLRAMSPIPSRKSVAGMPAALHHACKAAGR
jgi:hypothetical protein